MAKQINFLENDLSHYISPWISWVGCFPLIAYASNAALLLTFPHLIPYDGMGSICPLHAMGDTPGGVSTHDVLGKSNVIYKSEEHTMVVYSFALLSPSII